MAEGTDKALANTGGGSWWGSWINTAKTKTTTVFEAVKKDLDELSSAVRTEASNVGAAIESTLKFEGEESTVVTVKKSLSTFFGQVTEALNPSLDEDEAETVLITRDGAITLTGFQKHLAELQSNEKTYLIQPDKDLLEKYKRWMEVVEQDQFTQNRLARHLANSEILNEKYLSLVPEKIPHMEFWKRYLFKRALLEDALANAEFAEKRAKAEITSAKPTSPRKNIIQTEQPKLACKENEIKENVEEKNTEEDSIESAKSLDKELLDEDDINWEAEDMPCNVELTEEEQTRLLEQYEQEIQEREKRKSIVLNDEVSKKINPNKTSLVENQKNSTKKVAAPIPIKENDKKANNKQKQNLTSETNKKGIKNNSNKTLTAKQQQQEKGKAGNTNNNNKKDMSKSQTNNKKEELELRKDHFKKEENSSNSDESWEKDFDLNE